MIKRLWMRLLLDLWAVKAPPPAPWFESELTPPPKPRDGLYEEHGDAAYKCRVMGALHIAHEDSLTDTQREECAKFDALDAEMKAHEKAFHKWEIEREQRKLYDWPYEYARRVLESRDAE